MCLKISYRLNIKRHYVRSEEDKLELNSRKAYIPNQLWEKLSIRVSQSKHARRAFTDIDVLSKITGLKSELLYKLEIYLIVINSKHEINDQKCEKQLFPI